MTINIYNYGHKISEVDSFERLRAVIRYYAQYRFCGNMVIEYLLNNGHTYRESVIHFCNFDGIPLRIRKEDNNNG
mgnify:CR=1 FL=1